MNPIARLFIYILFSISILISQSVNILLINLGIVFLIFIFKRSLLHLFWERIRSYLIYLPLSGSTFKKIYYDAMLDRPVSKFIPAEDLVVPYYASDLKDCERITHVIKMTANEVTKKMAAGSYRDIDLID